MGSKKRITNKLRQNDEYPVLIRFLKQLGLPHQTHQATGKAHPFILITLPNGDEVKHSISCTPSGGGFPKKALAYLKRDLRRAGYDVG